MPSHPGEADRTGTRQSWSGGGWKDHRPGARGGTAVTAGPGRFGAQCRFRSVTPFCLPCRPAEMAYEPRRICTATHRWLSGGRCIKGPPIAIKSTSWLSLREHREPSQKPPFIERPPRAVTKCINRTPPIVAARSSRDFSLNRRFRRYRAQSSDRRYIHAIDERREFDAQPIATQRHIHRPSIAAHLVCSYWHNRCLQEFIASKLSRAASMTSTVSSSARICLVRYDGWVPPGVQLPISSCLLQ